MRWRSVDWGVGSVERSIHYVDALIAKVRSYTRVIRRLLAAQRWASMA